MKTFISVLAALVIVAFIFCTYLDLKNKLSSSQTKIEYLESTIVEKDRLILVAEVKDLLLKDINNKNMDCIGIAFRCNELIHIKNVKRLQYRCDSLESELKNWWH